MESFTPSAEEMALASRLLEMNTGSWNPSDRLGVETAIGLFKQSGLSFKQIRDIWSIADKDGTGKLSKTELAIVIRLAGWIQAGEILDEKLLETGGPLPKIKGISDAKAPSVVQSLPPVTSADAAEFKEAFLSKNPINGVLPKRSVMSLYMAANPDLSFELLFQVMKLIDTQSEFYDFKSFAVGLHTVRSLNKSLISSVPSSLSSEELETINRVFGSWDEINHGEGSSNSIEEVIDLPLGVDSDIHNLIEDIKRCQYLSGKLALDFSWKYSIDPTELSRIWDQSAVKFGPDLSPARIACFEQLIRKRVAEQLSVPESLPLIRRYSSQFVVHPFTTEPTQTPGTSDRSKSTTVNIDPIPTSPDQTSPHPPSYALATTPHEHIIQTFKDDIGQLATHFETIATDRKWAYAEIQKNLDALVCENLHLKQQQKVLEDRLASKEENCREAENAMNSIKLDLLEQQVVSKEHQEAAINVHNEAGRLWDTIETQSRQITTLLELVADMKTTITELNVKPDSSDLRIRFLRATARKSEEMATKAFEEAVALRETIKARDEEIVGLRKCLDDRAHQAPTASPTAAIQSLREDHEDLKLQIENMQRLLEHAMASRTHPGAIEDEETLVQPSAHMNSALKPKSSLLKLSELSFQHSNNLSKEQNCEITSFPPAPLSRSTRSSSLADTTTSPFQLFRKISAASSLARSCSTTTNSTSARDDNTPQDISQLENDLHLFRLHVQRKGYIGIEMVERFISNYDIDVYSLDVIGRFVGLDASVKRINQAVNLIRKAVIGARDYNLSDIPLPITPKRPGSSVPARPEAMLSNPARSNPHNASVTSQPSLTRFCNPLPSSSVTQRYVSIPKSITSSGTTSITSTLSMVNSSVQSTRAVCNSS